MEATARPFGAGSVPVEAGVDRLAATTPYPSAVVGGPVNTVGDEIVPVATHVRGERGIDGRDGVADTEHARALGDLRAVVHERRGRRGDVVGFGELAVAEN